MTFDETLYGRDDEMDEYGDSGPALPASKTRFQYRSPFRGGFPAAPGRTQGWECR